MLLPSPRYFELERVLCLDLCEGEVYAPSATFVATLRGVTSAKKMFNVKQLRELTYCSLIMASEHAHNELKRNNNSSCTSIYSTINCKIDAISTHLEKASNIAVKASLDRNGAGVHVVSNKPLRRGEEIISCYAVGLALDPPYRHLCSYCVAGNNVYNVDDDHWRDSSRRTSRCSKCFVASICKGCKDKGADRWHEVSGECNALSSLVYAHHQLFNSHVSMKANEKNTNAEEEEEIRGGEGNLDDSGGESGTEKRLTISLSMADEVDSSYILTVRIMLRRWSDCETKFNANFSHKENLNSFSPPFPRIEWTLLKDLYTANIGTLEEKQYYDTAIHELCRVMKEQFVKGGAEAPIRTGAEWINKKDFDDIMGKVVGCGHAVTDVTTSLGCQCLGRALFLEHSFYNHSCAPNAFLSCQIGGSDVPLKIRSEGEDHQCALIARVHSIKDTQRETPVTLSYIPTSGLDSTERRRRLKQSYDFQCVCDACEQKLAWAQQLESCVHLPDGSDVELIRQMQYDCNNQLLKVQNCQDFDKEERINELQCCISTIGMNMRGIRNQGIPPSHEVSIEAHRLLAAAQSLYGDMDASLEEHASFLEAVDAIRDIFDPVALSTSLMEYGKDLAKACKDEKWRSIMTTALDCATSALGKRHDFVRNLQEIMDKSEKRELKRQRLSGASKLSIN